MIAADPDGAEQRRKAAERHADVRLYGEVDQTATIVAGKQPQIEAAAAFARLTALARARKAAGLDGPLSWHRSQVFLGLLLGTLPPIPPAEGAPPDQPPPDDPGPDDGRDPGRGDGCGPCDDGRGPGGPGDSPHRSGPRGGSGSHRGGPDAGDLPAPCDEDAPDDDGLDEALGRAGADGGWDPDEEDDDLAGTGPGPVWPDLGAIPPALARPVTPPVDGRPVPGLLDLTLPWATLAGHSAAPGLLGRIGPITAAQARHLATTACHDPAAQWRIIITNPAGQALTVTRIPRRTRDRPGPAGHNPGTAGDGPPPGAGLAGRITLTITQDTIRQHADGPRPAAGIAAVALRAAARALDTALTQAQADTAAGGCAHHAQSQAYRPPPRLREHVTARDLTCRNPACRQPAWRADLDHTQPWQDGGPTCTCNLGGACRRDHQLKQHPRWTLQQTRPGHFTWTTPAGRTYTTTPDTHPL